MNGKYTFLASAAVVAGAMFCGTSCAGGADKDGASDKGAAASNDTLSSLYGDIIGYRIGDELRYYKANEEKDYKTEDFLAGVEYMLAEPRSAEFVAGMSAGLQMISDLQVFEKQGAKIDYATVVKHFRESLTDSVAMSVRDSLENDFQARTMKLQKAFMEAEDARLGQSPEASQNIKTAEAMIAKLKASDAEVKTTESGLTYRVWKEGAGAKIKPTDRIVVHYTGSHLDGKVFDTNANAMMTASPDAIIAGLAEGLQMLSKGAKATFYVPGALAYKGGGVPQAGIGPMETLVFDVEILDVNPPIEKL